jgi:outer membrane cobalamin receptor
MIKTRNLGNYIFVFIVIGIMLFSVTGVWAEEEKSDVYEEEEVVVTATRTSETVSQSPGVTEIINKEEIADTGAGTVSEALVEDGMVVPTYGGNEGVATIRIDGSSAEQTLILINGVPANQGCNGTVDLSYFPTANIDRVEIVHGPLSALYGANALGGVVNIITDLTGSPKSTAFMGEGSFNTRRLGLTCQQEQWGFSLGGNATDGFRERSAAGMNYLTGQYDFKQATDEYLNLYFQYMSKENQVPGSLDWHPIADQSERNFSVNLNGMSKLWDGKWEYKLFGHQLEIKYQEEGTDGDHHRATDYGADLAGVYSLGDHEILGGVMLKRGYFDSSASEYHEQNCLGIFFQDSWDLNQRWKLISGLRWDDDSNFQSPVSPRVNLAYSASDNFTVKAGYGKAFRAPTINDLYYDDPVWGMYGNPNLKPEIGERYDLIGEWREKNRTFTIDFFQSNVEDGIRWVDPENDFTYTADNIDKLRINGVVVNLENTWQDLITGRIGYQWVDEREWEDGTSSYSKNKNVFGESQFIMGVGLKSGAWRSNLDWRFIGGRSDQGTTPMADYNVVNFSVNYRANPNLNWVLKVDNLANASYQIYSRYPMPGRDISLNLNYTF